MEENFKDMYSVESDDERATQEDESVESLDEGEIEVPKTTSINPAKNDRSLSEFFRWHRNGRIIVDPEWQRRYVWDRKRASRLIESFLIDLPVPVVYLATNDEGKYEVIDGLQRLTSIFDFFNNQFSLEKLEIRSDLIGKKFSDLPPEIQGKLEDATLRTFELSQDTDKDLLFVIFERLNTGGVTLNEMEIRNCLFRGKLNSLLKELSSDADFLACVNQKNLGKRMMDRALVLRFLAFYQMHHTKARKGLKSFFNEFLQTYRNPTDEKISELRDNFKKAMRACKTVFGDAAFRLRRKGERGGEWTPRVNASIFQVIAVCFCEHDIGKITRSADRIKEAFLDLIATDERWIGAIKTSTGDFANIEYSFETWRKRLVEALEGAESNDSTRVFSFQLKKEMFEINSTCAICSQKIAMINDAQLDHDIQYWRGGRTVPENARLVHRICNLKRQRIE